MHFVLLTTNKVFGEIMIDYDYVECTSSALQALCLFREMYPDHRTSEVNKAVECAVKYVHRLESSIRSRGQVYALYSTEGW